MGKRRSKTVRKMRAGMVESEELTKQPHTFIFAKPDVGSFVKQLSLDLRSAFEPFTATKFKFTTKNKLRDLIDVAGVFNVTHFIYLTHKKPTRDWEPEEEAKGGGVHLHVVKSPHGPSFTFRVLEYSLKRDVLTAVRKIMHHGQYQHEPLIVMQGFSGEGQHLKLLVNTFQNMLPPLNVTKLKLGNIRRVIMMSREEEDAKGQDDVIHLRHYNIRTENRGVSRAIKKMTSRKKVPNLAKYTKMEDVVTKSGMLSDSGMSDAEDLPDSTVEIQKGAGLSHMVAPKATVRCTEIGPRLSLQLIKIEEGLNSGTVLYHRYVHKTEAEQRELETKQRTKKVNKAARKAAQTANSERKMAVAKQHRERCLEGMRAKGQLVEEEDGGSYHGSSDEEKRAPMKRKSTGGMAGPGGKRSRQTPGGGADDQKKPPTLQDVLKKRKMYAKKKRKLKTKKRKINRKKGKK